MAVQLLGYVKQAEETGLSVSGFWIQDYSGQITTVFGQRVFWNWCWNPEHYPSKHSLKGILYLMPLGSVFNYATHPEITYN